MLYRNASRGSIEAQESHQSSPPPTSSRSVSAIVEDVRCECDQCYRHQCSYVWPYTKTQCGNRVGWSEMAIDTRRCWAHRYEGSEGRAKEALHQATSLFRVVVGESGPKWF